MYLILLYEHVVYLVYWLLVWELWFCLNISCWNLTKIFYELSKNILISSMTIVFFSIHLHFKIFYCFAFEYILGLSMQCWKEEVIICIFSFLISRTNIYMCWKGGLKERIRHREKDLPSVSSLPIWPQCPELSLS